MKAGLFYASTTGTTAEIGKKIAETMGIAAQDVYDVEKTAPVKVGDYDVLILGASTHGAGDLQGEMEDFLTGVAPLCLKGKKIALFGCGDVQMTDTFCNGVGQMYNTLKDTGVEFIGDFPAGCYDYSHSEADIDGQTVGLLLDEENHSNLTPERITQWVEKLKAEA